MGLGEPKTIEEARHALEDLYDGICALQSLDDLGSEAANDAAWNDMLELDKRAKNIKEKWNL